MRTLWELFFTFFRLGIFTVGGGLAMIPLVYDEATKKKKWMTEEEMLDCVAVTQSLPGAFIINMATYIGKRMKGLPGAIAATLGAVLPSVTMMVIAMNLLSQIGSSPYVDGALMGAKAGAVGLVLVACYRLGKPVMKGPLDYAIALTAFAMVVFFRVSPIFAVLFGIASGLVLHLVRKLNGKERRR